MGSFLTGTLSTVHIPVWVALTRMLLIDMVKVVQFGMAGAFVTLSVIALLLPMSDIEVLVIERFRELLFRV